MTVTVIGGGASGMIAAVTAAKNGNKVYLLERQPRVGKKLLATGNGRCNLSNLNLSDKNYHSTDISFVKIVLSRFGTQNTLNFFIELGLLTVSENSGRVYPLSDQAGSVVDVLRFAVEEAKVIVKTEFDVKTIEKIKTGGFVVCSLDEKIMTDKVIIACGGIAGSKVGGVKSGYELLQSMGHHITKLYPSLVQIKTDNTFVRSLKGVRADAKAAIIQDNTVLTESEGELQFTEFGVSGPAAFEVSRVAATTMGDMSIHIDLLYHYSREEVENMLYNRQNTMPYITTENFLTGFLHNRLGRTILRYAGYELNLPIGELTRKDIHKTAVCCKNFTLPIKGTLGFESAQVTAGGARTSEFDPKTMQSRIVPGLYAAGEVLDVDGDCGGYNLQWAWASGYLAGMTLNE